MRYLRTYESYSSNWEKIGLGADRRDYQFKIDDNTYRVHFSSREGTSVMFFTAFDDTEKEWRYKDLEKSNPFKTMKVITEIVKDFISENPKVDKIRFSGVRSKDEIPKSSKAIDWILKIIASNEYMFYISTAIDNMLLRPRLWMSKPSKRTKMFSRVIDREIGQTNWKARRIGNEIQLVKL